MCMHKLSATIGVSIVCIRWNCLCTQTHIHRSTGQLEIYSRYIYARLTTTNELLFIGAEKKELKLNAICHECVFVCARAPITLLTIIKQTIK